MSNIIQYELFEPRLTEVEELKLELRAVRESCDKVRKSLFAKNGELAKKMVDVSSRLDVLERNICKGTTWENTSLFKGL